MHPLKRALIWLSRIRYCRGFGVQSPTDYRFVRYVVNEHYPYYQYEELEQKKPGLDTLTRKLCRLYFRLSNYCQSDVFVDVLPDTDAYGTYVTAACHKTKVYAVNNTEARLVFKQSSPYLVRASYTPGTERLLSQLMAHATEGSVVVVQGIKESREARRCWESLCEDSRVGAAYDLYYCGIIIIDNRRYKKKYIINF